MKQAPIPHDDAERLQELSRYDILDTLPEKEYDDLVAVASHICGTPIALVSLIDAERQWFKAKVGLDAEETPRDISFCGHAVADREMLVVPDASQDDRFADNPFVTGDVGIQFYAGAPLVTQSNHYLGTLCVIDRQPRELDAKQKEMLQALARQVVRLFELRIKCRQLEIAEQETKEQMCAAAAVQHALLPYHIPERAEAVFAWKYEPCDELGGDILNIVSLDEDRLGLYLLDVSGHGVEAALFSSALCHVLSIDGSIICDRANGREAPTLIPPTEVARRLNKQFQMNADLLQYFTIVYGILDLSDSSFSYICAGHPGPIVLGGGGQPVVAQGAGPPIGFFEECGCTEQRLDLAAGDRVYLYCDGILEARNAEREMFGDERLLASVEACATQELAASVDGLVEQAKSWAGNKPQDDVSVLAFEMTGSTGRPRS